MSDRPSNDPISVLPVRARTAMAEFFERDIPVRYARAPGRLDVMGGIADYSGSLVLQYPLAVGATAGVQVVEGGGVAIASFPGVEETTVGEIRRHAFGSAEFARLCDVSYDDARRILAETSPEWVAYMVGPVLVLLQECAVSLDGGLRIGLCSNAPEGKGIASSAAVETAVFAATAAATDSTVHGMEAARLCQIAENRIVGAPCGIMDQTVSAIGRRDRLLALLCQPAELIDYVEIPDGLAFFGIDSGIRHAVSGSDYTSVRVGAFMGLKILSRLADSDDAHPNSNNWNGYLANVGVDAFENEFAGRLPERMTGREFIERFGETQDSVTRVEPDRQYAVFAPTAHPIYEHARIGRFAALLPEAVSDKAARIEMGRLMFESHASYSACGLGSTGTDQLVEAVREAGASSGLYGAKITGGGSGGTVAVLAESDAATAVLRIAEEYRTRNGGGTVFAGSSPGAFARE